MPDEAIGVGIPRRFSRLAKANRTISPAINPTVTARSRVLVLLNLLAPFEIPTRQPAKVAPSLLPRARRRALADDGGMIADRGAARYGGALVPGQRLARDPHEPRRLGRGQPAGPGSSRLSSRQLGDSYSVEILALKRRLHRDLHVVPQRVRDRASLLALIGDSRELLLGQARDLAEDR